jgi:uncharacterized membrane protein
MIVLILAAVMLAFVTSGLVIKSRDDRYMRQLRDDERDWNAGRDNRVE